MTIRTALLVGFGLTLGLWLFAGYQVTRRMTDEQRDAAAINGRYIHAQELLATVRAQVLLASVVVGDALLEPDPRVAPNFREVERILQGAEHSLAQYVPVVDPQVETERVAKLREEIREYRDASQAVLSPDASRRTADAHVLLRRLMPKREAAVRTSENMQSFNRAAVVDEQRAIGTRQAELQRQVWNIFGVALFISLTIAWLASRHALRLEHRLTEQRAREKQVAADLQRLSARLVQVREDEQRRIARELHDDVGQALTAVKVELAVAERRLDRLHEPGLLADAQSSADSALRSVRDLTHLLHPSALEDLGLVAALESQVREFRRRHGVSIAFVNESTEERLHPEIERSVYRVVQEALTNIARHARARSGRVSVKTDAETLRVAIEDDGVGFDAADVERPGRRRGLGLLGMRERVSQLRGRIAIESGPGSGTRIDVELPRVDRPAAIEELPDEQVVSVLAVSNPEVERE